MLKTKTQKAAAKIKEKGGGVVSIFFIFLLSLSITSLMVLYIDRLPSNIYEGGIATQDIRADQKYEIIDQKATDQLKEDAARSSLQVYNYDLTLATNRSQIISDSFLKARQDLTAMIATNPDQNKLTDEQEEKIRQDFLINLGIGLNDEDYAVIRKGGFSEELEKTLMVLLEPIQKRPIVMDKAEIALRKDVGIVMRILNDNADQVNEEVLKNFSNIMGLDEAQAYYAKDNLNEIQKKLNLEFTSSDILKRAIALVPHMIKVNVIMNKDETDMRKDRARSNVQSIIYKLQKGQIIVRRGDRFETRHITILDGIRESRLQTNIILKFLGVFGLVLTTLLIVYAFAFRHLRSFKPTRKDLNFLGLVLILFLAILRLGSFIGSSLQDAVPFTMELATFYYAIPIAAGVMLVRFILNPVISLTFAIVLGFFAGLFLEQNFQITAYYFLSGVMAAYLIGGVEKRSSVLRRGIYLGLVNMFIVLSLDVINIISTTSTIEIETLLTNSVFAFVGGIFSSLVLLAISPIMEAVFNYTTNIQLLELANMNHPLLREMIVRAPGTYLHSQLVGTLAETGTRAIGGNSLLARVASYYHDIGKMKKPLYFIENQKGENPHDNLAPSMSALIVDAHVKDGLEMARESNLPKVIADFIPQHQGTKLIGYFYHKAQKEAGDDKPKVDERDYRYKGPKPQTREAGVVMLADTIEAAVRSMQDKSPQKIRTQVEKLVNNHFVDGQLDECDLTLRDLHLIIDAFVKILIGIYHQRVEYPEATKKAGMALNRNGKTTDTDPQSPSAVNNISPLFKENR